MQGKKTAAKQKDCCKARQITAVKQKDCRKARNPCRNRTNIYDTGTVLAVTLHFAAAFWLGVIWRVIRNAYLFARWLSRFPKVMKTYSGIHLFQLPNFFRHTYILTPNLFCFNALYWGGVGDKVALEAICASPDCYYFIVVGLAFLYCLIHVSGGLCGADFCKSCIFLVGTVNHILFCLRYFCQLQGHFPFLCGNLLDGCGTCFVAEACRLAVACGNTLAVCAVGVYIIVIGDASLEARPVYGFRAKDCAFLALVFPVWDGGKA